MRAIFGKIGLVMLTVLLVSSCGNRAAQLQERDGPDEFAILPGKQLQAPANYSDLPIPTPGAVNLTDPTPGADAIAVLGGRVAATSQAGDGALLAYTSRYGVEQRVSKKRGKISRFRLFASQLLDPYRELARLRAAGVKTPSAPPKP